jgi:omega-amidase
MRFAIAQIKCIPGDVESNCERIRKYAAEAKRLNADAVVFPEMTDTGYDLKTVRKCASTWAEPPIQSMQQAAAASGIHLFCGLSEREEGRIYNSIAVADKNGDLIGRYRKTHLFIKDDFREEHWIKPGEALSTVKIGNARIGLMICFDLRFPEVARTLVLNGAEILLIAAAWPLERIEHFRTLARARAIENECYVIACNRVGCDGGVSFGGSSCIMDPNGEVIVKASESREEIITAEITLETVRTVRKSMPVLNARRPDLYKV